MAESDPEIRAITSLAARQVGAAPDRLRLRRIPTGKFNASYFVEGGPVPLILRVAPPDDRSRMLFYEHRMMRQEPAIHALLRERTDVPVPAILAHDFGHAEIDRDYLLVERCPGTPISHFAGLGRNTFDGILREVGRCLRQAHALTSDRHGYLGEHHPMEPQPDWASAFGIMWNALLDDIEGCGGYRPDEAGHMRRLLDRHRRAFDRPMPASLLHMDVWAENILADERGRLTGLIDWDRACWGDPEIEFAVLDYCGISEPPFWEGYGGNGTAPARRRSAGSSTCCMKSTSTSSSDESGTVTRNGPTPIGYNHSDWPRAWGRGRAGFRGEPRPDTRRNRKRLSHFLRPPPHGISSLAPTGRECPCQKS